MEFELLENEEFPPHPWDALRRFLAAPRRQMTAWGDRVPLLSALIIFGLVVVEWVLAQRVTSGSGRGPSAISQAVVSGGILMVIQWALVATAAGIASLAGRAGNRRSALAYLCFGLSPLLLALPVTLLCEAAETAPLVRSAILGLLGIKVLSLWRDAIEVSFRLNRLQSAAAFYAAATAGVGIVLLVGYVTVIGRVASLFS